ncbi:MAG: helix-turn-helix domain-containing protein [Nanoarchaeota archaeon]
MKSISALIDNVSKKYETNKLNNELINNISTNLEFRLFFTIDFTKPFKEAKKEFMKNYFNDILVLSLGNISMAAKKAQLHRRHLHRMIIDLEIDSDSHRKELIKPSQYMKENISQIFDNSPAELDEEKMKNYNLDDISQLIVEHISNISYEEVIDSFEKEYIETALKNNNYNVQKTASIVEMSERTLYRKINKLNIAVA